MKEIVEIKMARGQYMEVIAYLNQITMPTCSYDEKQLSMANEVVYNNKVSAMKVHALLTSHEC